MLKKKTIAAALACALALGAFSGSALAVPMTPTAITVDGITWDPARGGDLTIGANSFRESSVDDEGATLIGFGEITRINGQEFCTDCDLTFEFAYDVKNIKNNGDGTTNVVFEDGFINFYVQSDGSFDSENPTSVNTTDLWLALDGHVIGSYPGFDTGGELFATVNGDVGEPSRTDQSSGFGWLDAIGGPAAFWVDTNTQLDGSDFKLNSSFSTKIIDGCANDPNSYSFTNICFYPIAGSGNLFGDTKQLTVPEPAAIGMLGLGLGFLGLLLRRRRKEEPDERS